ncbi:uncharacterized protein [Diabrotica undecimpunctata]|uniref:uncharacterized protein isoform X1 n=2 Tax=Diabrotica undecimpunctata TaxID=50387 RepID=UPI003B63F0B1
MNVENCNSFSSLFFRFEHIMASKHVLKISSITEFFSNDNKIIQKGENALESNHVKKMLFDPDLLIIKGEVFASMKDKTYNVEIMLNKSWQITAANCSCPRGIKCHHIATIALFGHYNISITDKTCTWNIPVQSKTETKTAEALYPPRPYKALNRKMSSSELEQLKIKLSSFGNTVGFTWLLQEEKQEAESIDISLIEDIIYSEEMKISTDKNSHFLKCCRINDATIKKIVHETTGQVLNEKWFLARKYRITSSNFGSIISCCKRNKYPESLFKTLIGAYNLDGIKSIQWGRTHEKSGIEYLRNTLNLDVQPTGIWLTKSGLLGASPDGLIGDDGIVEVKCPYTFRNEKLSEKLKNSDKYIISYNDQDEVLINTEHNYYHQIQGCLHILGRQNCYLCIWTLKEIITVIIEKDLTWAPNIDLLENFYLAQYLPKLLNE